MPPTRTIPPIKAVKTERTHEENQERAYIAASRRSDRSLEARVESARRASEIHKRRTGRSLRVTEQDVINEEMYEEEDDDLPLQYRRLTAHLQTGSADFNRRLAAYLTNQVAMRSAMEQMVQNSYNGQFPGQYPYSAQNQPNMFQSPMLPPQSTAQSPNPAYRPGPYPSPHHPGFRAMHGRAYSTAVLPDNAIATSPTVAEVAPSMEHHRRMSTPAALPTASSTRAIETDGIKPDPEHNRQTQSATVSPNNFPPFWQNMAPFTTALPPEAQQMLAPALDPNDPFSAMLMQGSRNYLPPGYEPWGDYQHGIKGMPVHPSAYQGMSTTLAPAALDASADGVSSTVTPSNAITPAADNSTPSAGLDFNFSQESREFNLGGEESMSRGDSQQGLGSGQVTPGEPFWENFVHDGGWAGENAIDS